MMIMITKTIGRLLCLIALATATLGMNAQSTPSETNTNNGQELFANLRQGDKAAIVAVHYGTTETSALATLDQFNLRLAGAFPNIDFKQAWTAASVIRKHNQQVDNLTETIAENEDTEFCLKKHKVADLDHVLDELWRDGYTHVLIQPSLIIEGVEMDVIRQKVAALESNFVEVRIGQPLLASETDYRTLLKILSHTLSEGKPVLMAAHGSGIDSFNGAYTMLDYIAHEDGKSYNKWYTATVSGFPTLEHAMAQAKADKTKKLTIVPLLFAFGRHAHEDLDGKWVATLKQNGIAATVYNKALGDNSDILDLYVSHAKQAEKKRVLTPLELIQSYKGQ